MRMPLDPKPQDGKRRASRKAASGRNSASGDAKKTPTRSKSGADDAVPRRRAAKAILKKLHRLYPDADCALRHRSAFELLVATILSAQSTDDTINKVTPILFAAYPTPAALAAAPREKVEQIVRSTGYFRQKAKNIQGTAQRIVEEFSGEVPDTLEALVTLPGVARKTANVVLGTWFGKNEGVVVDTHIGRVATRLGITWRSKDAKDAVHIERDIMEVTPREEWTFLGHGLIWHGRKICKARKPLCEKCDLAKLCPFFAANKESFSA